MVSLSLHRDRAMGVLASCFLPFADIYQYSRSAAVLVTFLRCFDAIIEARAHLTSIMVCSDLVAALSILTDR